MASSPVAPDGVVVTLTSCPRPSGCAASRSTVVCVCMHVCVCVGRILAKARTPVSLLHHSTRGASWSTFSPFFCSPHPSVFVCVGVCGLHGILSSKSHPGVCVCLGLPRVRLRIHFPFCQEHPARDQKYASNVKYSFVSANGAILKPVLTPDYILALLLVVLLLLHKLSHFVSPERAACNRSLTLVSLSLSGSLRGCKSCFLREATVCAQKGCRGSLIKHGGSSFGCGIVCLPTYASFLEEKKNIERVVVCVHCVEQERG